MNFIQQLRRDGTDCDDSTSVFLLGQQAFAFAIDVSNRKADVEMFPGLEEILESRVVAATDIGSALDEICEGRLGAAVYGATLQLTTNNQSTRKFIMHICGPVMPPSANFGKYFVAIGQ